MELNNCYIKGIKPFDFLNLIKKENISFIIDVRKTTWMPLPYRPNTFKQFLNENGIKYLYCGELGNPSKLRKKAIEDAKILSFNGMEEDGVSMGTFQQIIKLKDKDKVNEDDHIVDGMEEAWKRFENDTGKKAFWRGEETKAFKKWRFWQCIDLKKMDQLTKKYYLEYIKKNKKAILTRLYYFILANQEKETFCIICSCNTKNHSKCHRFWLIDELLSLENSIN